MGGVLLYYVQKDDASFYLLSFDILMLTFKYFVLIKVIFSFTNLQLPFGAFRNREKWT